jgi:hypothetical protein
MKKWSAMSEQPGARLVLDSKNSWKNLPYALMPAGMGIGLIAFPWVGALDPTYTAPIMIPFGLVWLLLALCISAYHSEVVLDDTEGAVTYKTSLLLHSWGNTAARGNVSRVVLRKEGVSHRFVMELVDGEDITVTTFDYWRSREWSEHVAAFLDVPLVDECRDGDTMSSEALNSSICEQDWDLEPPDQPPGKIEMVWESERRASIRIPPRGILRTPRPRLILAASCLLSGTVLFWYSDWNLLVPIVTLVLTAMLSIRPISQATHTEEIGVSPRGLHLNIVTFGRSRRASLSVLEIRAVTVAQGSDARIKHEEFDNHAVCVESIEGVDAHFQLGSHLPKQEQVEWLQRALLYILTMPENRRSEPT